MHLNTLIHQKAYEKIEIVLRRHWITFVPIILLFFFLLSVPVLLYLMTENLFPGFLAGPVIRPAGILVMSAYYLSIYLFFFGQFIDYYLDVWIITNDRVIDIEQFGLFSRVISELDLFRIQDVTTEVKGVFATLFHYGNVQVNTASHAADIIFRNVPNPNHIREELLRLSHIDKKYHAPHGADDHE